MESKYFQAAIIILISLMAFSCNKDDELSSLSNPESTCPTISETTNEDGTSTKIYDYGDGCVESGVLMKGKMTVISKKDGVSFKVIYNHYYNNSQFETNGYSEVCQELGIITFKDLIFLTYDNGDDYQWEWECSYKEEDSKLITLTDVSRDISKSQDYECYSFISEPLVDNFECGSSGIPVSGIRNTTIVKSGKKDTFEINYGDGTCDNYALVTHNGQTTSVDMTTWSIKSSIYAAATTNKSLKSKMKRKF